MRVQRYRNPSQGEPVVFRQGKKWFRSISSGLTVREAPTESLVVPTLAQSPLSSGNKFDQSVPAVFTSRVSAFQTFPAKIVSCFAESLLIVRPSWYIALSESILRSRLERKKEGVTSRMEQIGEKEVSERKDHESNGVNRVGSSSWNRD